jgi:hypothetical protein
MTRLLRIVVVSLSLSAFSFPVFGAQAPPSPEVQTPASLAIPELAALEAAYAREVRDKVDAPQQASMQRLNESYRLTLETAFKKTASQGLLDETVALQDELKRFTADQKVPETDEPGIHPSVAKLRSFWRAEAARIVKVRDATLQPLTAGHVASLRTLARELTKALKIDDARGVQARAEAFSAPAGAVAGTAPPAAIVPSSAPASTPSSPPADREVPPVPGARPADRVDLYAVGQDHVTIYVNNKQVLDNVLPRPLSKARVALKEGDVVTARNPNDRPDHALYLMAVAASGEFLFETSEEWHSYIPKDHGKWWDIKDLKEEQNARFQTNPVVYMPTLQRTAAKMPYYRGTLPIANLLRDEGKDKKPPTYCYHKVTRQDLLPKKLAPIPNPAVALAAPFLGKTIRIKTAKGGTVGVQGTDQLTIGEFDPKTPKAGVFKVGKGDEVGNIVFESVEKPGFFIRAETGKLRLAKGRENYAQFELMPPHESDWGVSVLSLSSSRFWQVNTNGELVHGGNRPPSSRFFIEEVTLK